MAEFRWDKRREQAAQDVAENKLTNEQIAERAGVSRQALDKWKTDPEFQRRVEQHLEEFRSSVRSSGIAILENRVGRLNADWKKLQVVVQERAVDPMMQEVPGGKTGLLVHQVKMIGKGESAQVIDEFAVDTGLLGELRALEQQAARELGQWVAKKEIDTRDSSIADTLDRKLDGLAERMRAQSVSSEPVEE